MFHHHENVPINSSFNGTMLVSNNHVRCNIPRFSKCISSFYVHGANQILDNSRCNGIKSSCWFVIQEHLYIVLNVVYILRNMNSLRKMIVTSTRDIQVYLVFP
jgi:hypothetical protein